VHGAYAPNEMLLACSSSSLFRVVATLGSKLESGACDPHGGMGGERSRMITDDSRVIGG
jgi:hypothetical protein